MTLVSGLVLDFFTDLGIEYATVLSINQSGSITASGTSTVLGYYELDVPSLESINSFLAYKAGYKSLVVTYSGNVNPIILHLQPFSQPQTNASGIGNISLNSATFVTSTNLVQVQDTPSHLYCCTLGGLDVIDKNTLTNVAYVPRSGGFTSICLDDRATAVSGIQLGTLASGVLEFKIPNYELLVNKDISNLLKLKYSEITGNGLSSNQVQKLSRSYRGDIVVGTVSGLDYFNPAGTRYSHIFSSDIGVTSCFVTNSGDVYYSPTNSGLYVKYAPITSGWTYPDYIVEISGTYPFPILSNIINDIKVSTTSGDNVVLLATRSGLLYYEEDRTNLTATATGCKIFNNFP